jgi:hypothetical protein
MQVQSMKTVMIWAQKILPYREYSELQALFDKNFLTLKGPSDMMLVTVDDLRSKTSRVIMCLPDQGLLTQYEGFTKIAGSELPYTATLLVGHQDRFRELFPT